MIRDRKLWDEFEIQFARRRLTTLEQKLQQLEALHKWAVKLGTWPPKDIMEGLDADIRVANVINSHVRTTSKEDRLSS